MRFEDKITVLLLAYPGSITSWIRSKSRNTLVGGANNSLHLLGLAVDIVLDSVGDKADFKIMAQRLNLWVLDEGDHLHVQEVLK